MNSHSVKKANEMIAGLRQLAYNLWWTWTPPAQDIFHILSERKWRGSNHNAVAVLNAISEQELRARLCDAEFAEKVRDILEDFEFYMNRTDTWCASHSPVLAREPIAYFSAEFGLHECLSLYSGGLGVLAGDHTKSASDLGLNFIGIGLFYRNGYFSQTIAPDGWQHESYPQINPKDLPIELVTDENGIAITASVEIGHNIVHFHAWRINIGRAKIYLLDTNRSENELHHREITAHVYGGDSTTRICQEIILGIGGVRFLKKLGIDPRVYHMNEGHPAFLTLELLRERFALGEPKDTAESWVKQHCVFTTHTPVPAGHDRFTPDLMEFTLSLFRQSMNLNPENLLTYGRVNPYDNNETFCMTVLALKMSHAANAVSELHGRVSREMWKNLFGKPTGDGVPIGHVTNGVHVLGWMTNRTRTFWQKHLGKNWIYYLKRKSMWESVADRDLISDEEIWAFRYGLRRDLLEYARRKLRAQYHVISGDYDIIQDSILNADVLTIGFARRFATYKRAALFFQDFIRATEMINDEKMPIQLVFAGKAHPRDDGGKKNLQEIVGYAKSPALFGKVVVLENYDINVARHMTSGCDVWLNNPRRPLEASGTSGMKILVHGGLNCSILDGWWREAYDGTNGFAIGEDSNVDNPDDQDRIDMENLYHVLKDQLIPEFYDRDEYGIPRKWIQHIRRSMITLIPQFNTDRQVAEYVEKYYCCE